MTRLFPHTLIAVVIFCLTACGGGSGGGQTSEPSPSIQPIPATSKNLIFVTDKAHRVLAGVNTLSPTANSNLTANVLSMQPTADGGVAYDAQKDLLYVTAGSSEFAANSIIVFENASTLRGSVKPSRTIYPAIGAGTFGDLILDKDRDTIYVNSIDGSIAVLNNASKLNGAVVPNRVMPVNSGSFAIDFKRSILYVKTGFISSMIFAYPDLDTIDVASIDASNRKRKRIALSQVSKVDGLAVDSARDRLYLGVDNRAVVVVENASKAGSILASVSGIPGIPTTDAPAITLPIAPPPGYLPDIKLAFDAANDRLYVGSLKTVVVMNTASKLTTTTTPNEVVTLSAPDGTNIGGFAVP
jgi:hypothetical protein